MIKVPLMEIERFAIHDGPGIRSVVFLKGCPLHCPWCANPESQSPDCEQIQKNESLQWVGLPVSMDEVMAILERDADYYQQSGGGVTFSGGECMMHADALLELLKGCKERGWHTAVETSGMAPTSSFEKILPYTDLFLFDLKHTDPVQLKSVTGADLSLILKNLDLILNYQRFSQNSSKNATFNVQCSTFNLRLPCIPQFNIDETHFAKAFALAKELGISRIDLLPYHILGMEKYRQLGRPYPYPVTQSLDPSLLEPYAEQGRALGLDVHVGG